MPFKRSPSQVPTMPLIDLVAPNAILPALKVNNKKQALQEIAARAAVLTGQNERTIFETLMQREKLGSTAVGNGIAIPHGKMPHLTRLFGLFARLDRPIDFDALDGQPVDLIFLLLAPEGAGADHLKALARVARLLRDATVAHKLRASEDAEALYAVLAMPSAEGLFHSAGVQSGSSLRLATRETATKSADALLGKLGIAKGNIADIQKVPWQQILEAQSGLAFSPVVEGSVLPHHPFDPAAPPESANVPVVISSTLEDAALSLTNFDLDDAGLKKMLTQRFSGKADEIYALYHKSSWNAKKSPYLIQAQILTDGGFRRSAIAQAERKAALGKAPAYMYLWAYESPGFGGKFGAVHGTDVSASFNNYQNGIGGTGSPEQRALWTRFASAWVALAKTGNPNCPKIPNWPAYDAAKRATMAVACSQLRASRSSCLRPTRVRR